MGWFEDKKQSEFTSDFGFMPPKRTKTDCKSPVFKDKKLHRIAIMKDKHMGNKGDLDEGGISGWVSKFICTGCGKSYSIGKVKGYFHVDNLV
jgi:hypothetical protein